MVLVPLTLLQLRDESFPKRNNCYCNILCVPWVHDVSKCSPHLISVTVVYLLMRIFNEIFVGCSTACAVVSQKRKKCHIFVPHDIDLAALPVAIAAVTPMRHVTFWRKKDPKEMHLKSSQVSRGSSRKQTMTHTILHLLFSRNRSLFCRYLRQVLEVY